MPLPLPRPAEPVPPELSVFLDVLRARRIVTFVLADNLGDHCALTNLAQAVVFLADANTEAEMRATITHELLHLAHPDRPDDEVEAQAAELLIPLPDALAAQTGGDLRGVAARLGVDVQLVRARIRGLPRDHDTTAAGCRGVG